MGQKKPVGVMALVVTRGGGDDTWIDRSRRDETCSYSYSNKLSTILEVPPTFTTLAV